MLITTETTQNRNNHENLSQSNRHHRRIRDEYLRINRSCVAHQRHLCLERTAVCPISRCTKSGKHSCIADRYRLCMRRLIPIYKNQEGINMPMRQFKTTQRILTYFDKQQLRENALQNKERNRLRTEEKERLVKAGKLRKIILHPNSKTTIH